MKYSEKLIQEEKDRLKDTSSPDIRVEVGYPVYCKQCGQLFIFATDRDNKCPKCGTVYVEEDECE